MTYPSALKTAGIGFGNFFLKKMTYPSAFESAGIGIAYASAGIGLLNYIDSRPIPALFRMLE